MSATASATLDEPATQDDAGSASDQSLAPTPPSPPASSDDVFAFLARDRRSIVSRRAIAIDLAVPTDSVHGPLAELVVAGLVAAWQEDGPPTGASLVTLTDLAARRLNLVLSGDSRRWRPADKRLAPARLKVIRFRDDEGVEHLVLNETDLNANPPGRMEDIPSTLDDGRLPRSMVESMKAEGERAKVLREERAAGLIRPECPSIGIPPWPLAGQDRGRQAPGLDPHGRYGVDGPPVHMTAEPGLIKRRRIARAWLAGMADLVIGRDGSEGHSGPCSLCGGKRLAAGATIRPRWKGDHGVYFADAIASAGPRGPRVDVDGDRVIAVGDERRVAECCLVCGRHGQEHRFPEAKAVEKVAGMRGSGRGAKGGKGRKGERKGAAS